jgi:pyridoxine 5-phosphate synthase
MTSSDMAARVRLGVNVDHVATLRNARGSPYPDPLRAAQTALEAGADIITAHLREDRRHIRDADIEQFTRQRVPLNLEMAATPEMTAIALRMRPKACCIVPERREEITTEGGLDVRGGHNRLAAMVRELSAGGIEVSLFIAPDAEQIAAAAEIGAPQIELHTGAYCEAVLHGDVRKVSEELAFLEEGARVGAKLGLEVHAGHGLTYDNVGAVARIPEIVELQIGHFLVGEAVFVGLSNAIGRMRAVIDEARGT